MPLNCLFLVAFVVILSPFCYFSIEKKHPNRLVITDNMVLFRVNEFEGHVSQSGRRKAVLNEGVGLGGGGVLGRIS